MISEVVTLILSFGPHTIVASAVLSSVKSITLFLSPEILMSHLLLIQEPKSQQLPRAIAKMTLSSGDSHSHILSVSSVSCPGMRVCPHWLCISSM